MNSQLNWPQKLPKAATSQVVSEDGLLNSSVGDNR